MQCLASVGGVFTECRASVTQDLMRFLRCGTEVLPFPSAVLRNDTDLTWCKRRNMSLMVGWEPRPNIMSFCFALFKFGFLFVHNVLLWSPFTKTLPIDLSKQLKKLPSNLILGSLFIFNYVGTFGKLKIYKDLFSRLHWFLPVPKMNFYPFFSPFFFNSRGSICIV